MQLRNLQQRWPLLACPADLKGRSCLAALSESSFGETLLRGVGEWEAELFVD